MVPEVWIIGGADADHYVDITDTFAQKIAALKSHASQIGQRDGFEEFLRERLARMAGAGRPARGPPGRGVPGHRRRLSSGPVRAVSAQSVPGRGPRGPHHPSGGTVRMIHRGWCSAALTVLGWPKA